MTEENRALHTAGPWEFSSWGGYGDLRFYVAQADGAPFTPNHSDVAKLISETVVGERAAIQEANARLIAAAPELLEALECAIACGMVPKSSVADGGASAKSAQVIVADMIRAAIAKATGAKP